MEVTGAGRQGAGRSAAPAAAFRAPLAASATLAEGRRYLSVVLDLPEDLAERIGRWRRQHGARSSHRAHITLFMTELREADAAAEEPTAPVGEAELARRIAAVCARHSPLELRLHGTGSFRPVSEVAFAEVAEGREELVRLHRALAAACPDASPFRYRPHLTLAHGSVGRDEARTDAAMADFQDLDRRFTAVRAVLCRGDATGWERIAQLPFRGQAVGQVRDEQVSEEQAR